MNPIVKLYKFKSLLSTSLLALAVNEHNVEAELQAIIKQAEQFSDEEHQRKYILKQLDELFLQFDWDELSEKLDNHVIQEKAFVMLCAGFISSLKTDNDDDALINSLDLITQLQERRSVAKIVDYSLFTLGHLNFLEQENTHNPLYVELCQLFGFQVDLFGLDPFKVRSNYFQKVPTTTGNGFMDFHGMLEHLELTQGEVNEDHICQDEVPHRIHMIWNGGIPPQKYRENIMSWLRHNPNYNLVIYMDSINEEDNYFIEFKAWCKKNGVLLVSINSVINFHSAYTLYIEVNNARELYGAHQNNYGAASDIARYIILRQYLGIYADVPDVRCIKAFPTHFVGNKLLRFASSAEELDNNDFMIAGNDSARDSLTRTLDAVAAATVIGAESLDIGEIILVSPPSDIEMHLTVRRTGVARVDALSRPGKWRANSIWDSTGGQINSENLDSICAQGFAGTWLPEHRDDNAFDIPSPESSDFLDLVAKGITGLLRDLHFYPYSINFDKYPIFSHDQAFEVALLILNSHFNSQLEPIANIIAYNSSAQILLNHLDSFPRLYMPFIHIVCKTKADKSFKEKQANYVLAMLKAKPELRTLKDHSDNNIFMSACRNGNFTIALELVKLMSKDEFQHRNTDFKNAFELMTAFNHPSYFKDSQDFRPQIIDIMRQNDFSINESDLQDLIKKAINNVEIDLAVYLYSLFPLSQKTSIFKAFAKSLSCYINTCETILNENRHASQVIEFDNPHECAKQLYKPLLEAMLKTCSSELDETTLEAISEHYPNLVIKAQPK